MYNDITAPAGAGLSGGLLVATGTSSLWWFLASFALIAAGTALMRIIPRGSDEPEDKEWFLS